MLKGTVTIKEFVSKAMGILSMNLALESLSTIKPGDLSLKK